MISHMMIVRHIVALRTYFRWKNIGKLNIYVWIDEIGFREIKLLNYITSVYSARMLALLMVSITMIEVFLAWHMHILRLIWISIVLSIIRRLIVTLSVIIVSTRLVVRIAASLIGWVILIWISGVMRMMLMSVMIILVNCWCSEIWVLIIDHDLRSFSGFESTFNQIITIVVLGALRIECIVIEW